jgi:hypothetical protein
MLDDVLGYEPASDVVQAIGGRLIPLSRFAQYKSVIWSVRGHVDQPDDFPLLHDIVQYHPKNEVVQAGHKVFPNLLSLFMATGGHVFICGDHPIAMSVNKDQAPFLRYPVIFKYELDRAYSSQEDWPDAGLPPPGDQSFAWKDLCLETMDFAVSEYRRRRNEAVCPVYALRRVPEDGYKNHSMRAATPLDNSFPPLDLRVEAAAPGRAYAPQTRGLNVEVYNPEYFFSCCNLVWGSRNCFEPIYALECFDTEEPVYGQPIAFWCRVFNGYGDDYYNPQSPRNVVWGFAPVMFEPKQVKPAIDRILFDEWGLPRE